MEVLFGILRAIGDFSSAVATAAISKFHDKSEQE